jgi:hypothetical protein
MYFIADAAPHDLLRSRDTLAVAKAQLHIGFDDDDVHADGDDEVSRLRALISSSRSLSVSMMVANGGGSPKSMTPILR